MRRLTLARRVVAMVAAGGVALVAGLVLLIVVTGRYDRAVDDLLNRIGPSRQVAGELLTTLVEQRNAVHGYVLTGDPAQEVAYRGAVERQTRQVAALRAAALGDDVTAALDRTVQHAGRWQAQGGEPLIAVARALAPRPAVGAAALDARLRDSYQREERLFDPVGSQARDLVRLVDEHRDTAADGLGAYRRTELVTLVVAILLAVVAAAATLLLVRRWVIRPVERLARDARVVADGELDHRVGTVIGPPELAAMAGDVERMRSRIVTDLAEVRSSRRALAGYRDRLEDQTEELRRSNRDLEQFAYVASHDLQEPLRKVAGFCQLLQRRYADRLDERAVQYIDFAVDGAQRMQRLIGDLLAFSRVGRGGRTTTEVDLDAVVREIAGSLLEGSRAEADLDTGATGGGGTTGERVDPGGPAEFEIGPLPRVRGDEALLRQLLTNLLGNAVKFAREGVPARVVVEARPGPDQGGWTVSVADNGIGINPEFADRVFVIFQRLHAREAYPGTGIGLALAKRIVEHHGGRIWLDTARTDGATVSFSLPPERHAREQPDNREEPLAAGGTP